MISTLLQKEQIPGKQYKEILLNAQSRIKQILDKKQSTSDIDEFMEKEIGAILLYMCSQKAYEKPFYTRSIVLIDNVIPHTNCIHELLKSDYFGENIRKSFEKNCYLFQQKANLQKKLNLLYAHLYLMLYLIKIFQEDMSLLTILYKKVFGPLFLRNFSSLPFNQMDQNSIRVGSMIIANLVSKGFLKDIESVTLIKSICGLCSNCHDSVARSYLILALYHMKQLLCKNELRKNNVIKMLVSNFERGSQRQTQRILITLSTILQSHPQLAHDLTQTNFLQLWQNRFPAFPELSLKILKLFLPFLDKNLIQKWLSIHLSQFLANRSKTTMLQLMVCNLLIQNMRPVTCLMFLSEGIFQAFEGKWEKQLQKIVLECKQSLIEVLRTADPNLMAIYVNFSMGNMEQGFRELQ